MCLQCRGAAWSACCGRIDVVTDAKSESYCIFVVGVRKVLSCSSLGPSVLWGSSSLVFSRYLSCEVDLCVVVVANVSCR